MSMGFHSFFLSSQYQTNLFRMAKKTADVTINNDNSLNDDPDMQISVGIGTYIIDGFLIFNSAAAADIKIALKAIAGATAYWGFSYDTTPTVKGLGDTAAIPTDASNQWIWFHGTLTTTAAGTLILQWCQNTADAGDTIMRAESYISATKVA